MTKLRGGPELLAPPATAYLPSARGHRDHHLDFSSTQPLPRDAHPTHYKSNIACDSPGQRWHCASILQPEVGARLQNLAHDQLTRGTMPMEKVVPRDPGSCYMPAPPITADPPSKPSEQSAAQKPFSKNGNAGGKKKKNYQRYPKPPYSYLAMIAMVIQNSPEKKLTLSEILKEISSLFPFFKGNYKGWRDSVRHNLSSYDCFVKVLKDPGKPQGKGNFWAVEVSRVPLELLKRQNTAVSRQDETIFAQDLAPYILQGHTPAHKPDLPPPSAPPTTQGPAPPDDPHRPKLDSSFAIDSLLHSFRPASTVGEGLRGKDSWGVEPPHNHLVSPLHPRHPSSNHSASASSASPASSSSDEEWRGLARAGKRVSDGEAGPDGYDHSCPPPNKTVRRGSAPPWELPTSYAKYTPPNAVAPPSMRFGGGPFVPLGGIPFYSYSSPHVTPSHFSTHGYWPLLPSRHVSLQAPPLLMDLDRMLQSVPPNKSVFDVLGAVNQTVHSSADQHPLQHTPSFSKYS